MGTEIQDFAAELRGLKERSGLSYGALAGKLHMSTSTVHRYCNGDAVPHDYAPVERFARVCRASGDELVALHRKWILADEAKRRGARKPEAGGGPGARAAVERPGAAAAPDPVSGRDVEHGTEHGTEPVLVPVPEQPATPGSSTAPQRGTHQEAESLPEAPAAGGPDPTATVPAPRRTWSGRAKVLLAAAAVVALTVPGALAVHGFGEDDPADEARPAGVVGGVVVTPGPAGRAGGAPSAGGSPTPGPASGSPSATVPSASPGTPAGKGGEAGNGGVPVHATITSYNWEAPCGQYYLLDRAPEDVPAPPPAPQGTRGWAKGLGGVDGGAMRLALTLQGTSGEAVVLNAMHVRVVAREPALAWSAYSMGEGCGSGITPQSFDIDLDDGLPRSTPVAGQQGDEVVPAKDFPYQVSSTDVEVFHLDAHVEDHDVTWYLELEWTSGGRSGTLRVDDGGKPFRTSGIATRPEYRYRTDIAQWEEAGL
nr:helix-turn-helix transcriptional regulator [Streptomyces sp. NRRL WC-3549]